MDAETLALVDQWIVAFCEPPVLIDRELMWRVLAEHQADAGREPRP